MNKYYKQKIERGWSSSLCVDDDQLDIFYQLFYYFRISALLAGLTDSLAAMIVCAAPGLELSRNMLALFTSLSPLTVM